MDQIFLVYERHITAVIKANNAGNFLYLKEGK